MKKIKLLTATIVMMMVVFTNGSMAQAAGTGMTVQEGESTVRLLSETERALLQSQITETVIGGEISHPLESTDSYDAYEYSQTFHFYNGDTWIASAEAACVVYRYTDGKVHLYSREITLRKLTTYAMSKSYGSIVNTDGSVCYTTGDRVYIYGDIDTWAYAIDFSATPTGQSFNCYEVNY